MAQYDFGVIDPQTKTGTQLAGDLNQWRDALHSLHSGNTRPAYVVAGMLWRDTSVNPAALKVWDGSADVPLPVDGNLVHRSGNETITGNKTFSDRVTVSVRSGGDNEINAAIAGINYASSTTVGYPALGYNIATGNASNKWRFAGSDNSSWMQFVGSSIRFYVSTGTASAGAIIPEKVVASIDGGGLTLNESNVHLNGSASTNLSVVVGTSSADRMILTRQSDGSCGIYHHAASGAGDNWAILWTVSAGTRIINRVDITAPLYVQNTLVPKTTSSAGAPAGGAVGDIHFRTA